METNLNCTSWIRLQEPNNKVTYELSGLDGSETFFEINPDTGVITVAREMEEFANKDVVVCFNCYLISYFVLFQFVYRCKRWRCLVVRESHRRRQNASVEHCHHRGHRTTIFGWNYSRHQTVSDTVTHPDTIQSSKLHVGFLWTLSRSKKSCALSLRLQLSRLESTIATTSLLGFN